MKQVITRYDAASRHMHWLTAALLGAQFVVAGVMPVLLLLYTSDAAHEYTFGNTKGSAGRYSTNPSHAYF